MQKVAIFFHKVIVFLALIPVYLYRLVIRPLKSRSCAFYPTCSSYAIIAIKRFGPIRGWLMTFKRLGSCSPLAKNNNGYWPVPYKMKGGAKWVI